MGLRIPLPDTTIKVSSWAPSRRVCRDNHVPWRGLA